MIVAVDAAQILFPSGNVRLTTLLAFAAFVALAIQRRSWLPLVACAAWLAGFEVALNLTVLGLGRPAVLAPLNFAIYLAIATGGLFLLVRRGCAPRWPLLAAAAAVWIVWISTGFHVNGHSMRDFSASAEVWNELSKMLWAAAYFLPFARSRAAGG